MTNRILISVFFICLISCASMLITAIWAGGPMMLGPVYFQINATLFVIGLASFLTWFVRMVYALYLKLTGKC